MRTFQPGDKVRFLSTKGSGIVKSVGKGIVNVLIEDGFEIPVEASDLVVIEPQGETRNPFLRKGEFSKMEAPKPVEKPVVAPQPVVEEAKQPRKDVIIPDKGLYLAFVPQNQETLISGEIDVFLINYSSWQLAYHFLLHDSRHGFQSLSGGLMTKGEAILIDTVSHSALKFWSKVRIQTLCLDLVGSKLFSDEIIDLDVKPQKFIKEDIYQENPFFDDLAHLIFAIDLEKPPLVGASIVVAEPEVKMAPKKSFLIDRYMVDDHFAEVDLHIEKLRGDHKTMRKEDMMKTQISIFRQCLDSAIEKGIDRVVFIHGVGAGLLKKEIQDILNEYSNLKHSDASILKYGIGATEVFLKL